jgi:hypothetical protein
VRDGTVNASKFMGVVKSTPIPYPPLALNTGPPAPANRHCFIAGVLELGIHAAGVLGKFYAENIEHADDQPQQALRAIAANKVKVLAVAVPPQVWP